MTILTIERLGHRGDGIAFVDGAPVFVAGALPGERARIEGTGDRVMLMEVLDPSADRVEAPCPHFLSCGGCAVQHLADKPYRDWKSGIVSTALEQAGLDVVLSPLIDAHGKGRRRLTLHMRRERHVWQVGLAKAKSHDLIALDDCLLLAPGLKGVFALGRAIAALLPESIKEADLSVTASETGLDVALQGVKVLAEKERLSLLALAQRHDVARLTLGPHMLLETRPPTLRAGAVNLRLPPAAFLQATQEGEDVIARLVIEGIGKAKHVFDLFCGLGTFALRIAENAAVTAYDSDPAAINALQQADRFKPQGYKAVKAETRDLFRRPIRAEELKKVDAVVIDPARSGAEAQFKNLAKAPIKTIISVSCNPATFARDAKILVDAGWTLESVTPVDQFRYSPHVEVVGVLRR